MRAKASKIYVQRVVVQISSVPYDMMRYDNCVPATEQDAGKLERVAGGYSDDPADRVVEFRRFARTPGGPTADRWRSFNCEIVSWEPSS